MAQKMNELESTVEQVWAHLPPAPLDLMTRFAAINLSAYYQPDGHSIIDAVLRITADCICANDITLPDRLKYKEELVSIYCRLQDMISYGMFSDEYRTYIDKLGQCIDEIDVEKCSR